MRELFGYCCIFFLLGYLNNNLIAKLETDKPFNNIEIFKNCQSDSIKVIQCSYYDISRNFNYQVIVQRYLRPFDNDSCLLSIHVLNKNDNKIIDSLQFTTIYLWEDVFQSCKNSISFTTKSNHNSVNEGFLMQDFVVGDFNFDSKEDFAIIKDCSNSGPMYNFYIQNAIGKFELDNYLTDSVKYFPNTIDKDTRSLTIQITTGYDWISEHVFTLNFPTNEWKEIKRTTYETNKNSNP